MLNGRDCLPEQLDKQGRIAQSREPWEVRDVTRSTDRVRWGELGGYVIALGGLAALVCLVAFPGATYLISLSVMVLGLLPVMVSCYELGGRTPEGPARVALTLGSGAVLVFVADTLANAAGIVTFDESRAATGAFAVVAASMVVFGSWLAVAPILAGRWLPPVPRWLGVACGLGWAVAGIGLLLGGSTHPLVAPGGIGYQLLFPAWGLLIARRFRAIGSEAAPS
jgi:hypothetical protein